MPTFLGFLGAVLQGSAFAYPMFTKHPDARTYHELMIGGSGLLLWYAFSVESWIFLLLEGALTVVSLVRFLTLPKKQEAVHH